MPFDTGNGRRGAGLGMLRERLGAAGYAPENIGVVVVTHCHPDHIGGLLEDGAPAFPNARCVFGGVEFTIGGWARACPRPARRRRTCS